MFLLLCFCLVLAVMFMVFALTTLASWPALRLLTRLAHHVRAGTAANLLFVFRAIPLVVGVAASLGFVIPAFLEFEPRSTHERLGPMLLLLTGLGLFMIACMGLRCWRILRVTLILQRRWLKNATPLVANFTNIPVFCVNDSASLVAIVGIFVPRIFVSRDVANALSEPELNAALSHELAHVNTCDNLRQLVLKITQAPRFLSTMSRIDSLWASMSELAADERAITQGASPLDLSSALVKVGRLSLQRRSPLLAASHLVDGCSSSTFMRAGRLRDLLERGTPAASAAPVGHRSNGRLAWAAIILFAYLFALGTILPKIHEVLEFIVR
jgi:hypothetical protein